MIFIQVVFWSDSNHDCFCLSCCSKPFWFLYVAVCPAQLLLFLKAFSESEQAKLAMLTGILLATGTLPPAILTSLFSDNIVKEGLWKILYSGL